MITENGIVTKSTGGMASVSTTRSAACKVCSAKDSCGTIHKGREMIVEVPDTIGAKPGDAVVIGIETAPALFLTFIVYVVPILFLMAGALVGNAVAPLLQLNATLTAMVIGFSAFGIAFLLISKNSARLHKKKGYKPVLVRRQNQSPPPSCQASPK